MSFEIGDRVRVKNDTRNLKGTIVELKYDPWSLYPSDFIVEFDDKTLIPPRMAYPKWDLEIIYEWLPLKCTCGLDSIKDNGGRHSDWCDKYNINQYIDFKGND